MQIALRSQRPPFLTQVIRHGQANGQLSPAQLQAIRRKGSLMSLKFADKFYNQHRLHLLEQASNDVIGVTSLGLMALSQHNLDPAVALLCQDDGLIKSFQKGWSMLSQVSLQSSDRASLFGEVDARLLEQQSSPAEGDDWQGWLLYEQAQQAWRQQHCLITLKRCFFADPSWQPHEHFNIEDMLAQVLFYRLCTGNQKVQDGLKRQIKHLQWPERGWQLEDIEQQLASVLAELPDDLASTAKGDLGPHFSQAILQTIQFAKQYQRLQQSGASPEKRDAFELTESRKHPLLGWPQELDF